MNKRLVQFSITIIALFSIYYIWYCNFIMVEVPHLTWFTQIKMADQFFSKNFSVPDLFSRYGEHGMLANNMIYLLNVILFHGMTKFDVLLNDVNVIITGSIIIYCVIRTIDGKREKYAGIILVSVFLFTCMQGSSGAMETQVRLGILFFVIASLAVDKELYAVNTAGKKHMIKILMLVFLSINVFGTMYSFAAIPLIWGIIFYNCWRYKRLLKTQITVAAGYLAAVIIYVFEYRIYIVSDQGSSLFHNIILFFAHPIQTLRCIFSWCVNGVLGWSYHESREYSEIVWLVVGGTVFIIILLSCVLFFTTKMYVRTWMPLIMITYSFGVMFMVFLGRDNSWEWFANEWYNVQIKLSLAGVVWILAYAWERKRNVRWVSLFGTLFLCICSVTGSVFCLSHAPHVRAYYQSMQPYLFINDQKDMPTDEKGNTPLLCSLDETMEAIRIIKKYRLSVYRYWDAYESCPTTEPVDQNMKYISGIYDDGWVEKECEFSFRKENATDIKIVYYALNKQKLTVIVNGEEMPEQISLFEGQSEFVIPCDVQETVINIKIKSDYAEALSQIDARECSFIISDIVRQ